MNLLPEYFYRVVSLIITLVIIGVGMALFYAVMPIYTAANEQANAQARMAVEAQFSRFDNSLVSGSQILTAYRMYNGRPNFYLYVRKTSPVLNFGITPGGGSSTCANINFTTGALAGGTINCSIDESRMTNMSDSHYIEPQGRFSSRLIRDHNEVIVGILFVEQ